MRLPAAPLAAVALAAALLASPAAARAEGGTITGKVEATPSRLRDDTVVFLRSVPGPYAPRTLEMDQRGVKFIPRILAITQGDTVRFLNNDDMPHNVYSRDGEGYNLGTFKRDETASRTFKQPGVFAQLCTIHPEMLAWVFVGQNPYAAAVDVRGRFTIRNVPPGTWAVAVWNAAQLGAPDQSVTVAAGQTAEVAFSLKK